MEIPLRAVREEPDGIPRQEGAVIGFEDFFRETHAALFRALSLVSRGPRRGRARYALAL